MSVVCCVIPAVLRYGHGDVWRKLKMAGEAASAGFHSLCSGTIQLLHRVQSTRYS